MALSSLSFEVSSIGCDLSEVKFDTLRIFIDGDLRDLVKMKINKKDSYIFALNNSKIKILVRE